MESYRTLPLAGLKDERAVLRAVRLNALGSLFYFVKHVLRRRRLTESLHLPLCQSFERWHIKDVVEIPRDHFKSTCASEGLSMWRALPLTQQDVDELYALGYSDEFLRWMLHAHNPNSRNLLVSGNITNAAKLGKKIRWHFESNNIYRATFPETLPDTSCTWTDYSLHVKRPGGSAAGAHGEGTFDFLGVGSAVQSRHYNGIVIEDDLIGIKEAESQALMDKAIDYHQLLVGIFEAEDPNHELDELVIGNRWGYADLNSHLRENEPDFAFQSHSALGGCCAAHPPDTPIFPEEFSLDKLLRRKQRLGNYKFSCFPAGTPILMLDSTIRPVETLQVGDWIVGFHTTIRTSLKPAQVEFVNRRESLVIRVTTSSGRVLYCTPDHQWLKSSHNHRDRGLWFPATVGKELCSVYTPLTWPSYPEVQRDLDWLGGILDGEGSVNNSSGTVLISQSNYKNPDVHSRIQEVLERLGLHNVWESQSNSFRLTGGRGYRIALVNSCKMSKTQRFASALLQKGGNASEGYDEIVDIKPVGRMPVYNIQSSSGNYVAWGFACKNCQFLNNPSAPEDADFRVSWLHYFDLKWNDKSRFTVVPEVENGIVRPDLKQSRLNVAMVVDPNHSGNQARGRCRHAIVVCGCDADGNHYLLESWAQAASFDVFYNKIFEIAQRFALTRVGVETVAAQRYIAHHLLSMCAAKGYSLRIDELRGEVDLGDGEISRRKEFRIRNVLSPIAEQGRLWVQRRQVDFVNEYQTFPKGRYVDALDALAYAPQLVRKPQDDASHFALLAANQSGMDRVGTPYSYGFRQMN